MIKRVVGGRGYENVEVRQNKSSKRSVGQMRKEALTRSAFIPSKGSAHA
jgi:hypothetical protein